MLDKRLRKAQPRAHLLAGPEWRETGYLFTDASGDPLHPNAITRQFRFARELANRSARSLPAELQDELPLLSVHGLRHTFATIPLQAGVPVHRGVKYPGHSSVTMTLNVYAHASAAVSSSSPTWRPRRFGKARSEADDGDDGISIEGERPW